MQRAFQSDGEFWFSAKYAAELLGTTKKKIEAMVVRELLRANDEAVGCYVAESDVTRLRNDPSELKRVKEAAKMPAHPRPCDRMSENTAYVDDRRDALRVRQRVGLPLADQGHKK